MSTKENFSKAITNLKQEESKRHKQRTFNQTVDLIINLRNFDVRKNAINSIVTLPHNVKEKKIAGFLERRMLSKEISTRLVALQRKADSFETT